MAKKKMTVIDHDAAAEALKNSKAKRIKSVPSCHMKVQYEMDQKLYDKIKKDSGFLARFHDEVRRPAYLGLVGELTEIIMVVDQQARLTGVTPVNDAGMRSDMKKAVEKYRKLAEKNAKTAMTKYLQVAKDKNTYVWDVRINAGMAAGSVIMSGVSLGMGMVTGGLSITLTAVSMAKSMVQLVREYQRTKQDADQARENLQKTLKYLKTSYASKSKTGVIFAELGAQGAADFLVYEKAGIKRAEKELLTFKGKFATVHEKSAAMGAQLNDLIDSNSKMLKNLEEVVATYKNDPLYDTQLKILKQETKKRDAAFKAKFKALAAVQGTITETEKFTKKAETGIAELKQKKPGWVVVLEKVITGTNVAANPGIVALATNGANLVSGLENTKQALSWIKAKTS